MAHYELREVAPGAWAAIAAPRGRAVGNAGIVDLGDRTVVFDTTLDLEAANGLHADAHRLTGRLPDLVVNSHWHADHVRGNQVFEGAEIVSTVRTRDLIETLGAERLELHREQFPDELAGVVLTPPTRTFDDRLDLGRAYAATYGGGHTASDAFLYVPEDRLLFAADLVVIDTHPWVGDGDCGSWLRILDRLEALDVETLVPGHGPVGVGDDIALVRAYLEHLLTLDADAEMPPEYADLDHPELFERNLAAVHG